MRLTSGEMVLYSGHSEGASMLAPEAQQPVNSRIITAQFATQKKNIKMNIIQCYATTNDAIEEKKDDRMCWSDRQQKMSLFWVTSMPRPELTTLASWELGQMNENGERLADLRSPNQLVIRGNISPHKQIHKATWRTPDHVTENQIDHICISIFRRSCQDVRVK